MKLTNNNLDNFMNLQKKDKKVCRNKSDRTDRTVRTDVNNQRLKRIFDRTEY